MTVTLDYAIVGLIIQELKSQGSWCGETHIQKTAFVARDVWGVPLSTPFVLYKHGPYSFDLNSVLASMRADRVLALIPQQNYGPSFALESAFGAVAEKFKTEIDKMKTKVERVAGFFGRKNVADLERVATAIFITLKGPNASSEVRATELNKLKPHIAIADALDAIAEADNFLRYTQAQAA